ncbi:MAG: hypothetical protein MJZ34_05135 [Paludibacteraceae bacterium]|nr:hypothetical protein [Paludibacteraceae bacterium]
MLNEEIKKVSKTEIENNYKSYFNTQVNEYIKRWNIKEDNFHKYSNELCYVISLVDDDKYSIEVNCDIERFMIDVSIREDGDNLHTIKNVNETFFHEGSPEELIALITQAKLNETTMERKYDMQNVIFRNGLISSIKWDRTKIDYIVAKGNKKLEISPKYDLTTNNFNVKLKLIVNDITARVAEYYGVKIGNMDEMINLINSWERL